MKQTWIVGYDGSDASHRAVAHAAEEAKAHGARLLLAHVLEWSPYSFLTPEELDERHKRREQELVRGRGVVQPAVDRLTEQGIDAACVVRYGHAGEILCEIAAETPAARIIIGRTGGSSLTHRLLGSLAINLAQAAPVPVTIVP
ncbi:MAG: universal stress protein [Rubrivivax sp.]|nr:universal stress protein [Rubrivivax sp.]